MPYHYLSLNHRRYLAWKILILFICQTQKKIPKQKLNIFNSISLVVKTAFSNRIHIIIGSITGIVFWVVTNMFDNILFFSPFLAFHVPSDMLGTFLLSCVNSILVAAKKDRMGLAGWRRAYVVKRFITWRRQIRESGRRKTGPARFGKVSRALTPSHGFL